MQIKSSEDGSNSSDNNRDILAKRSDAQMVHQAYRKVQAIATTDAFEA